MLLRSAVFGLVLLIATVAAAAGLPADDPAADDPDAIADLRVARGDRDMAEAWLIAPTTRYDHFVHGSQYEAGGLRVRLRGGQTLTLMLDDRHVFEDRQPRLADLDGDGRDEIVLVLTALAKGASLAVYDVDEDAIRLEAKTPFIGQPHRWLNPVGPADFDGDGQVDVGFVAMPHLVKRLEIWTLDGGQLRRMSSVDDVANHRLGSRHIRMSAVGDFDGDGVADLAVPNGSRTALRLLSLVGGATREIASLPLGGPADGEIVARKVDTGWIFEVPLETGGIDRVRTERDR